jgi:3-hydroxybutyryl-CoA dehydrogenase
VVGQDDRATGLVELFSAQGFDARAVTLDGRTFEPRAVDLLVAAVSEEATPDTVRALAAASADAIVVTTASTHSLTRLAMEVASPDRIAGLHFGPQDAAAEVLEIVAAEQTDPAVVEELTQVVGRLGKTPVVVKDNPGFLVDWLFLPFLNDVVQAYDEELATAEDIDAAVRLGLGYRAGPFEMLEQIGVQRHLAATTAAYEVTYDVRFAPPARLRRMALSQQPAPTGSTADPAEKEGTQA